MIANITSDDALILPQHANPAGLNFWERQVEPLLIVRRVVREQLGILHRRLLAIVRDDDVCRRLMTIPGVRPVPTPSPLDVHATQFSRDQLFRVKDLW
jgi:hypothetical protein